MDAHQHRLLHKIDEKLDLLLECQDMILEAIEASGDPAKVKAITTKLKKSAAALKTAVEIADQAIKGN